MSKLKRFNKSNGKNNTIKLIVAFLLVAVMSAAISYAVYQKEDEVLFINARVGEFETTSSDIELAMKLDGNDIDTPPSKGDGYYNVTIECDHADGNWDMDEWLAKIGNITSNRVKCNINFETLEASPLSIVELGDYISMTPTSTSYTISTSLTGYTSNQTINPSELNLWRVIRKNDDGTVDVVSEYVSSKAVYFRGQVGYLNFVNSLNTIAAQYTNSKYVLKTRHMGYSGQTLKCTTNMTFLNADSCPEDYGYLTDYRLVMDVLGTVRGSTPEGTYASYWLASRDQRFADNGVIFYCGEYIHENGSIGPWGLVVANSTSTGDAQINYSVRPIITLKSDIDIISGDGKSTSTSYQLS